MKAVEFRNGKLRLLDQTTLPHKEEWVELKTVKDVAVAIKQMKVRGAPAIGVAAAYGMVLSKNPEEDADILKSARPTAVDLFHAVDFMLRWIKEGRNAQEAAQEWDRMTEEKCASLSKHGATLIAEGQKVLTHCNTGFLATNVHGSALGAVKHAHAEGKKISIHVDETRPRFQGALTSWELLKAGIPHKVICDSSAGFIMSRGEVDLVMVGADRIAANGDAANKIGTYSLSVLAKEHGVPFYVLAPLSSFDFSIKSGEEIAIEERDEKEVLEVQGKRIYPEKTKARNLAFDVTPARNITAFVNELGVFKSMEELREKWKSTKE
jgi:methylthioribose-1-phosphate isomerase